MTLLLIPGFMADATLWDAMTDDLAPFGPLVATDLSRGEDIETMAAAILSDAPESFVAVGFSMGGYVARELARIAPERAEALILIATSARGDTEELIRQRRSALKAPPRAFKGLSRPAIVSSLHPDLADDEAMIARVRDMGLRLGGEVFHSILVHLQDGLPIQLEDRFVNPRWVPHYLDSDFSQQTPNEVLVASCPISDVEHVVEAVLVDAQTAAWLDIDPAAPCLSMIRRTWSDEHLVSYARLFHPGDRYKLRSHTKRR